MNRLLHVDLTHKTLEPIELDRAITRAFLGGSGLAAALIAAKNVQSLDPLGPENPLVFMSGPLCGTSMPSAGRYSVCALSPLTGIWGEANSGGFFGPELRAAGYDGIRVVGSSDAPVWLAIEDGHAQLRDASFLAGLDTYATQDAIQQELGDAKVRVACIGPAGEWGVRFAAVMNDHGRAAGRSGMGAVMGSKGLKAIAVRGHSPAPVANEPGLREIAARVLTSTEEDIAAQAIRMAGTAGYFDMGMMYGDVPIRLFTAGAWEGAETLSGVRMSEEFLVRRRACDRCPIACGRETRAPRFGVDRVDGPEYETLGALGSLLQISDLESVIFAGHRCNALGMDTISLGGTIALACELFEQGTLTTRDTDGLELGFGRPELMLELIELAAQGKGFGQQLAEGSLALATRYGVPELSPTVKGLELPMHDPRAFHGLAVTYALSPRGACHMQGDMYSVDTGQLSVDTLAIEPGDRFENSIERGRMAARTMLWRTLYNAINLCQFQNPGFEAVLDALNAATGWEISQDELLDAGRRILALKRWINGQRGVCRIDDCLPTRATAPLSEGGTLGEAPDVELLLTGAYQELGWGPQDAMPSPELMQSLDIDTLLPNCF